MVRLGKRTAKIVREAIVLAHVHGVMWGQSHGRDEPYPPDANVVFGVLAAAANLSDIYPTLSRLDEAKEADAQRREQSMDFLAAVMASRTESGGGR